VATAMSGDGDGRVITRPAAGQVLCSAVPRRQAESRLYFLGYYFW